jgi:hypothetical protein
MRKPEIFGEKLENFFSPFEKKNLPQNYFWKKHYFG